jgi:hypothetical protein
MLKKRYYVVALIAMLSISVIVGLHVTGYLFNDQQVIPPVSLVEWESIRDESGSQSLGSDAPPMLNLADQLDEIPGIKSIKYKIFVSSESMEQVLLCYTDVLENDGYAYHSEYSGMQTYQSSEIFYHAFAKGLNGVVIFLSEYNQHTWVCYTTGGVLQYQQIFDYLTAHTILH